ncbi:MAG: MBL fold metallo-hydrolase [Pseudomonadota bacterium]|jgi:glyoxylase-like metal-dependent hydrolase (beta-lactamase superfamily II)|nr:MBL fold metallo-hydrolase [Pseudomonadota bacterium]MEC8131639.1 MBL fold metallo-hydrolase [Pseudomonadota bacterium]GIS48421.1 MAG: MBL fold metallo-hydrolase [Gammaproteobacteria bacterium]|tara:strand:- start:7160 stop:7960 length:801 start_codon:yes stop_codon:yes gene_type:complete
MNELIEKITAPNGGVFTGNGTNTYLLGKEDLTLIDPGPKNDEHIDEIIQLGGGKINRILVTHTHKDHSPAALPISKILDVPMYGRLVDGESEWEDETFVPDKVLNHGDLIETNEYSIEVVHTPGHASNHLCFYLKEQKCLLTGDHIMDGSTVVIAPPDGKMRDYLESLELLKNYDVEYFAPGHGNFMDNPEKTIDSITRHRLAREAKVLRNLEKHGSQKIDDLLKHVYSDVPEVLFPIAKMSLLAHLIKLIEDKKVNCEEDIYSSS